MNLFVTKILTQYYSPISQVDFAFYNIVLDINFFEWNKTPLSRRIGCCAGLTAIDFLHRYSKKVAGLDGKVRNLKQSRQEEEFEAEFSEQDYAAQDENEALLNKVHRHEQNEAACSTHDDTGDLESDHPSSSKKRKIDHRDPMDDEILRKKQGI